MTQAQTWVRRLKESDPSVCTEVFDAMYGPMLRYATWVTQDEEAAYDILQDVFFNLWQGRQRLNPDLPLKALLFKMTRNRALNHQRKKQHHETRLSAMQEIVPDQEPHPDNSLEVKMLGARIHQWISELPPRRREAFQLSRYEGLSHEEIAQVMNLTSRTVSNHIMLALVYLRKRLRALETNLT